jgi:hypothetical protein
MRELPRRRRTSEDTLNDHRLQRLKRLAAGAALIGATVAPAQNDAARPVRANSPPAQKPVAAPDAGVPAAATEDIQVNSPPPKPKPNLNSPPPKR